MTKDLLIIGAVVALVAIMVLAALPEITNAMPDVYYVEPTEPETAAEAKAETVLQSTASVRYALTAAERDEIERVVMAEAGAEPYIGQMAVAQCILNACEQEDKRPLEIVRGFGYTAARPEPTAWPWISVNDRLPKDDAHVKDGDRVLVIVSGRPKKHVRYVNACEIAEYYYEDGWYFDAYPEWEDPQVTYWMPLPERPEDCHE